MEREEGAQRGGTKLSIVGFYCFFCPWPLFLVSWPNSIGQTRRLKNKLTKKSHSAFFAFFYNDSTCKMVKKTQHFQTWKKHLNNQVWKKSLIIFCYFSLNLSILTSHKKREKMASTIQGVIFCRLPPPSHPPYQISHFWNFFWNSQNG